MIFYLIIYLLIGGRGGGISALTKAVSSVIQESKEKGTPPISRHKQIKHFDTPLQDLPPLISSSFTPGWWKRDSLFTLNHSEFPFRLKKQKNITCIPQWIVTIVFYFLVGNWRLLQSVEIIYRVMKNGLTFLSASLMFQASTLFQLNLYNVKINKLLYFREKK